MPDQLQLRGGTTTEHNSFTGASKEVTVDTTKKTLVVHDGATQGGTPLMKESGGNAASSVAIGTGGNNVININSSQKVGIGTTPATTLSISGTEDGVVNINTSDSRGAFIRFGQGGSFYNMVGCADGLTSGDKEDLGVRSSDNIIFAAGGSGEKMRINSLGNVGIGTATIADDADHCKLAISGQSGTAAGILIFQDTSNNEDGMVFADNGSLFLAADRSNTTADSTIRFRVDGSSEKMRIDHVGRVLIGTTTPLMNENGFNEIYLSGTTEGAAIHFSDANNNVQAGIFTSDQSNKMFIRTITNHPIVFRTNNTDRMKLDENGNLSFTQSAASNYPTQQIKWSNDSTTTNGFYIAQHSDRNGRIWHEQGLSLVFGTSNQERMTILPDGHVGIGTTTPDLLGSTTDSTYLAVIETSGTRRGKLLLGDNQNVDTGGIGDIHFVGHYQNSGHKEMATIKASAQGSTSGQRGADLVFETKQNGVAQIAHAMTIKSDGRVFIGNNNPAASANADDLCIGYNDSAGETGITLGSNLASGIRWADGQNNSAAVLEYQHNNTRMVFATEGGTRLILDGDGIKLGGETSSSHGLDDYEEGTFTPSFYPQSSAMTLNYDYRTGHYTKIGNTVYFQFRIKLTSIGAQNANQGLGFSGLPFNPDYSSLTTGQISCTTYGHTWTGEVPTTITLDQASTNRGTFRYYNNTTWHMSLCSDLNGSSSYIVGSGFYFV